jgi:hypothetical protein
VHDSREDDKIFRVTSGERYWDTKDNYVHVGGTLLVAQLVEALRYKSEGRGFDSR